MTSVVAVIREIDHPKKSSEGLYLQLFILKRLNQHMYLESDTISLPENILSRPALWFS
jgi:hypothetical protein